MLKVEVVAVFSIFTICFAVLSAQAQAIKPNSKANPEKVVTNPINLADLPQFTGQAKYVDGSATDNRGAGTGFRQRWFMKEGRAEIVNWYRSALSGSGWTLRGSAPGAISAKNKSGNHVSIYVNEISLPDHFKCETVICYYQKNQDRR